MSRLLTRLKVRCSSRNSLFVVGWQSAKLLGGAIEAKKLGDSMLTHADSAHSVAQDTV